MITGKIAWKCIKVPVKFVWKLSKFTFKVIARLAWRLSKMPLKAITPMFLQNAVKEAIKKHKAKKLPEKQEKSKIFRMKTKIKKTFKNLSHKRKNRRHN